MMYNKGLFHPWVSKPVSYFLITIFTLPLLAAGGVYVVNSTDMYSGMGILSEDISFANNASTIGMMVGISLIFKIKAFFRSKEILVASLLIMAFLSIMIGNTDNSAVLFVCSLLMGFVKIFGMVEVVLPAVIIISPDGDRGKFYSVFYPLSICAGQVSSYLIARLAYEQNWRFAHFYSACLLCILSLVAIIVLHNKRPGRRVPIANIDSKSILLFLCSLISLNYFLVYLRQQGWFASDIIKLSLAVFIISLTLFIRRHLILKIPYIPLKTFWKRNVATAVILIFFMGMFLATSSLQSTFTAILRYDSPTNSALGWWSVPGVIVGGFLASQWFKRSWSIKTMFLVAFCCFEANTIIFYFLVNPVIEIEQLYFMQFLRGLGMCLVYIGGGFYFADKLTTVQMMSSISVLVGLRTFIGTAIFGALFSWAMYAFQWDSISGLAGERDAADFISILRGSGVQIFSSVQVQGTLVAIKQLLGYISLAGVVVIVFVMLHPFRRMHHRKVIYYRKLFSGRNVQGYKVSGGLGPEGGLPDAITAVAT